METRHDYIGFWKRACAAALDAVLFLLFVVPLLYMVHGRAYFQHSILDRGTLDILNSIVVPSLLLHLFWFFRAATPGKMAVSAVICDAQTGGRPTFRQYFIRYAGYYLSALFFGIGFLRIPFDPRKRGWHDLLAGTVVVHRPPAPRNPFHLST